MSDFEARMASAKALAVELGYEDEGACLAEQFGMGGELPDVERELEVIENEILFFKRQAGQSIIEIGKRLNEAKAQLGHGEWLPWLREKVDISERSAQDFMRLAREYSKSAEIADLGASKALALLALPVSDRADFTAEKHAVNGEEKTVRDMTLKELKQAIAERDEAVRAAESVKAELAEAEKVNAKLEADLRDAQEAEQDASEDLRRVEAELEELRSRPVEVAVEKVQDPEALEKAKADGAAEAEKKHRAEMETKEAELKKAQEKLRTAQEESRKANGELMEARRLEKEARLAAENAGKQAKVAGNENMVKFSILFRQAQDTVNLMAEAMEKEPQDNQGKMRAALNALAEAIRKAADA